MPARAVSRAQQVSSTEHTAAPFCAVPCNGMTGAKLPLHSHWYRYRRPKGASQIGNCNFYLVLGHIAQPCPCARRAPPSPLVSCGPRPGSPTPSRPCLPCLAVPMLPSSLCGGRLTRPCTASRTQWACPRIHVATQGWHCPCHCPCCHQLPLAALWLLPSC